MQALGSCANVLRNEQHIQNETKETTLKPGCSFHEQVLWYHRAMGNNGHADIPGEVTVNVVLEALGDSPALVVSPALEEEEEEDRVADDDPGVADKDGEEAD